MAAQVTTEDGVVVEQGDRVYNYYDMKPGVIERIDSPRDADGPLDPNQDIWFYFRHDDGSTSILNGQRICSIRFAERRGFPFPKKDEEVAF